MIETITWIDCHERLPDDDITVLVVLPPKMCCDPVWLGYHEDGKWLEIGTDKVLETVTHWAHMPEGC